MKIHAMIDLETLGTKNDTTILSLGAVKFDPFSDSDPAPGIYFKLDVEQQNELGRSIDQDTIDWWQKQDPVVREEAFSDDNREKLETVLAELNRFLVGVDSIWAQGAVFDIGILEHLYQQLKTPVPWHFWQIRDSRTLFKLLPENPRPNKFDQAHNALVDAYYQAKGVQRAYELLGVTE
jgi:3' exoribonuclease, RNase T-like